MTTTMLINATAVLPDRIVRDCSLSIADGRLEAVLSEATEETSAEVLDLGGATVVAGFIDVHNHGAVGVDVNEADVEGLLRIAEFLARHGVTAWMPTLVPDSDENYGRVVATIDELMAVQAEMPVAQAVGIHYEGVFASEKMCGALRPEYFKTGQSSVSERTTPSAQSGGHPSFVRRGADGLPRLANGVHMTTMAPEVDGGIELIRELVKEGWIVSIGHTLADRKTLEMACEAGACHMTHFFNAMTGLHHRDMGAVGWGLTNPGVTFDIIADGIHVDPEILKFAVRGKTPEMVSLISDSVAPTGLGDGDFDLWGERISVAAGRTQNERGSIAGSVITMHDAVKRMQWLGFSPSEVSYMASRNPAKLLGIESIYGSIEPGKRADVVALNGDGTIKFTMIGGRIVE